jgi:hypothetical protein
MVQSSGMGVDVFIGHLHGCACDGITGPTGKCCILLARHSSSTPPAK